MAVVLLLAVTLVVLDLRYRQLATLRAGMDTVLTPVYFIADMPAAVGRLYDRHWRSRQRLLEDVQRLDRENLLLKGRLQQMAALQTDNTRLRKLLNSSAMLRNDVLVAEVIGVAPDPVRHQLVLDKGARAGVYHGQPLIDANGLMGQVVEVAEFSARVLLITDATHSVPVQVNRNGVRAVAEGVGVLDQLAVHHVAVTTDIREGDLLVTSGLGQRFPIGYPVAIVSEVLRDPGVPFARISAVPLAELDRARHALLVFTSGASAEAER